MEKENTDIYETEAYKRFMKNCAKGRAMKDIAFQLEQARKIKACWAEIEADLLNEYKKLL